MMTKYQIRKTKSMEIVRDDIETLKEAKNYIKENYNDNIYDVFIAKEYSVNKKDSRIDSDVKMYYFKQNKVNNPTISRKDIADITEILEQHQNIIFKITGKQSTKTRKLLEHLKECDKYREYVENGKRIEQMKTINP